MNRPIRLLLPALILLSWGIARADDQAAPATQPAFQGSPFAQQAAARYESQKRFATKRYDAAIDEARRQYIAALKRELAVQARKHNTDLTTQIDNAIQQLQADADAYKKKLADAQTAAQAATAVPSEMAINLDGRVKMEFVLIPAGTFIMGSTKVGDAQPHRVTVSKPFYMGKYKVTQEQWQAVMGSNPSTFQDPKKPAENFDFNTCQDFIAKVNQRLNGPKVAMPTEAQWEYCCRAGTTTEYSFGDDGAMMGDYGWYKDNSGGQTHPVGQKKPNPWGLYDMHGDTGDWCSDWYGPYQGPAVDPTGPATGTRKLTRGGSWFDIPFLASSAYRGPGDPTYKNCSLGCRLTLDVPGN